MIGCEVPDRRAARRAFPWQCRRCAKKEVELATISYDAEIRHDGRLHKFAVPNLDIPVCRACGEKVFSEKVDDQINGALRSHLNLLTPADMRTGLERIGMTQRDAADRRSASALSPALYSAILSRALRSKTGQTTACAPLPKLWVSCFVLRRRPPRSSRSSRGPRPSARLDHTFRRASVLK